MLGALGVLGGDFLFTHFYRGFSRRKQIFLTEKIRFEYDLPLYNLRQSND